MASTLRSRKKSTFLRRLLTQSAEFSVNTFSVPLTTSMKLLVPADPRRVLLLVQELTSGGTTNFIWRPANTTIVGFNWNTTNNGPLILDTESKFSLPQWGLELSHSIGAVNAGILEILYIGG